MKLTTKGKFAVTAMLYIAKQSNNNGLPVPLSLISTTNNISISYLEQLFTKLKKFNLVSGYKGPGGGYLLSRDKNHINIAEIIIAVEDNLDARTCHGVGTCLSKDAKCLAHELWCGLTKNISEYLTNITLGDLINE